MSSAGLLPSRKPQVYARGMNGGAHHNHDDDWQPATSAPGELYTFEGEIRAIRAFGRGWHNRNPRNEGYRRSMYRPALASLALAVAFAIVISVLRAVF